MLGSFLFISMMASAAAPNVQTPQYQAQSAVPSNATAGARSEARAKAMNAAVLMNRSKKTATARDFKNRPLTVSVVSDEQVIKLFQEMTVQKKIPFGFPEDGCYARAHEMAYLLERQGIQTTKVVATGKFLIDSEKAAGGSLAWSWHIAPAVVVDDGIEKKIWVIDPSLFFDPVPLEAWLASLTAHPKARLTSAYLTRRYVYHPANRNRDLKQFDEEELKSARRVMKRYLKRENLRDQQKAL